VHQLGKGATPFSVFIARWPEEVLIHKKASTTAAINTPHKQVASWGDPRIALPTHFCFSRHGWDTPSPSVSWNHQVAAKMRFDLWGSITCGQNLEPQGVEPRIGCDLVLELWLSSECADFK
jgi:hypothetical protein